MAAVEGAHWWYCGLRDVIRRTLQMRCFALSLHARVLDAGCGTGGNLLLLQRTLAPAYLGGFDLSPLAVRLCRDKVPDSDVYLSDLRDPEIRVDDLDLILSCDAVSIAGMTDCFSGLAKMVDRLRRGGLLILNLPAFRWLASEHDVAIETRDRTTVREVRELLARLGLSIELVSYRLCLLFPAIVLARLPSMLRPSPSPDAARSDVGLPPRWINAALREAVCAENIAICHGARFPSGSSVYAVGRKC